MLEQITNLITSMMDYVLGWILYLPRDLMIFLVAILTSAILTFARKFTTNQDWLKRAADDKARLRELAREAKAAGDKPARKRHKALIAQIKGGSMKYELKPLAYAIIPIALLATWCFTRLGFHPPAVGETVEVRAYFPKSLIGRTAHLVPDPQGRIDLEPNPHGWVQPIVMDSYPAPENAWDRLNARASDFLGARPPLEGVARWRVKASGQPGSWVLKIRRDGRTYEKDVLVGSRKYASTVQFYDSGPVQAIEVALRPVKLFGFVGGVDFLFLPPWLVAYLLIAIPFVSIFKRLFRVY